MLTLVLEITAGLLLAAVTFGTAAPAVLALIAGNIAIGATSIVVRKGMLGDRYPTDEIVVDAAVVVAVACASELKVLSKVGKILKVAKAGVSETGSAIERGLIRGMEQKGARLAEDGVMIAESGRPAAIARAVAGQGGSTAKEIESRVGAKLAGEGFAGGERVEGKLAGEAARGERRIVGESAPAIEGKAETAAAKAESKEAAKHVEASRAPATRSRKRPANGTSRGEKRSRPQRISLRTK